MNWMRESVRWGGEDVNRGEDVEGEEEGDVG